MPTTKTLRACAVAAITAAALGTAPAHADVIYTFTTTAFGNTGGFAPQQGLPLSATLDLSEAAVRSGSFALSAPSAGGQQSGPNSFAPPPAYTGNPAGFTSLTFTVGAGAFADTVTYTPSLAPGPISLSLTFDAAGDVLTSALSYLGTGSSSDISGTSGAASGFVSSDAGGCSLSGANRTCYVSGAWSGSLTPANSVPEPASMAILGMGLLGLVGASRLRRQS